ncbi:MAG: 2-oxoglutarate dehydrogenase E2 component (dihydrolipoamide succinyltransferase) [Flavobacteriales bacterium]|jgi:2-oxoglutarate dehydrogenase E2 component (dihydrolipoamide succinyltransferase)|tara:strand:- start:3666 stop:4961 length:1296 start_codon:yes stop_codon:yes gene_type:complete
MPHIELILPKMGESVAEATLTSWLKNEGDIIELEEGILEIATDKVDSEVPSDYEGTLIKKLYKEGDVIKIGEPFAIIETISNVSESAPTQDLSAYDELDNPPITTTVHVSNATGNNKVIDKDNKFYSPLVKNIAKKEEINNEELHQINGTGRNGRVTKDDILNYLENRIPQSLPKLKKSDNSLNRETVPTTSFSGESEIIEMDRMRKLISSHMVNSKKTAPHVTSVVEIDVTNLVNWRNKVKDDFLKKEGYKLTFTPIFVEAVAKAIKDFPMINVSVDGENIIVKKDANIGMAVALPSGNLIVPVVKGANNLNLIGTAKSVNNLTQKARNNKLAPDDVQGGTFTITNIGTFGNIIGTPIINQPEVAILATGVIQKKPAVIETPEGDFIGIRQMMFMSMSYDHRVVDGMLGGSFLRKVGDYLENFEINRQIW